MLKTMRAFVSVPLDTSDAAKCCQLAVNPLNEACA